MRFIIQLILHLLCVLAGFAWMSMQPSGAPKLQEHQEVARSQRPSRDITRDTKVLKQPTFGERLALLTPDTLGAEISAIYNLKLAAMPAALRGALAARFPSVRRRLIEHLFRHWVTLDRASALTALRTIPSPQMKAAALRAILVHWVESDEQKAWQWVMSLNDDTVLQEVGMGALVSYCGQSKPGAYLEWAEGLQEPILRYKALHEIAHAWAVKDSQGAFAAAMATSNEVLRWELLEMVGHGDDPGVVRGEAMDAILQLPDRARRVRAISNDWLAPFAEEDPAAAFQWFVTRAGNPDLQKAAGTLGGIMAKKTRDLAEIHHQILQIPAGPVRDAFAAQAAVAWAAGESRAAEARALLELCGPCIERQHALMDIDGASTP